MQFAPNGDQLRSFGSGGSNPGQLRGASGIALTARGDVLVCDKSNHRVQQFTSAGQLVKCVGSSSTAPLHAVLLPSRHWCPPTLPEGVCG